MAAGLAGNAACEAIKPCTIRGKSPYSRYSMLGAAMLYSSRCANIELLRGICCMRMFIVMCVYAYRWMAAFAMR